MTIKLRLSKGSKLSHIELDSNFVELDTRVSALETGGGVGTDSQTLALSGNTLSISGGNSVDLSGLVVSDTDNQTLSLAGTVLNISNGNSVDLIEMFEQVDDQNFDLEDGLLAFPGTSSATESLSSPNGRLATTLSNLGTLQTVPLLPTTFTATVDSSHYVEQTPGVGLVLTGDAWYFEVEFIVAADGTVETHITNNTPWFENPGYQNDMQFAFTEADHGIPDYTFTLTLISIQNPGPFMYTTNLAASIPPSFPAALSSTTPIKLTAGSNSFVLGDNGNLTLPGSILLPGGIGIEEDDGSLYAAAPDDVILSAGNNGGSGSVYIKTNQEINSWRFNSYGNLVSPGGITIPAGFPALQIETGNNLAIGTSRYQTESATAYIGLGDLFSAWTEFDDDITVVQVGWTVSVGGVDYVVTEVDDSVGFQYRITAAGANFVTGTNYTFVNPTPIPYAWVFGNDGALTTPGSGTISHQNNDLKLEVTGTDVIVLRTSGGDLVVTSGGDLQFNDGTTQNTAYTGPQTALEYVRSPLSNIPGTINYSTVTADENGVTLDIKSSNGIGGNYDGNQSSWTFDVFGQLSLPASNGYISLPNAGSLGRYQESIGAPTDVLVYAENKFRIQTDTQSGPMWVFGDDGVLNVPGNIQYANGARFNGVGLTTSYLEINVDDGVDGAVFAFNADGTLAFPDSTAQTTAWTGGRVVAVPATSLGASGDQQGDLAFNGSYIYYCTANYDGTITAIPWTNISNYLGSPVYVQADVADGGLLSTGTLQITNCAVSGVTGQTVPVDSYELVSGTTYKFYITLSGFQSTYGNSELQVIAGGNIWKRVAWSSDTW